MAGQMMATQLVQASTSCILKLLANMASISMRALLSPFLLMRSITRLSLGMSLDTFRFGLARRTDFQVVPSEYPQDPSISTVKLWLMPVGGAGNGDAFFTKIKA
tara:strand:- start:267 stop:578 length:312 start_codon:yes stop_codon:yes gene_type:complete